MVALQMPGIPRSTERFDLSARGSKPTRRLDETSPRERATSARRESGLEQLHSDEQGGAQVRSAFRVENEAWNVQAGRAEAISPALRQSRAPPKRRIAPRDRSNLSRERERTESRSRASRSRPDPGRVAAAPRRRPRVRLSFAVGGADVREETPWRCVPCAEAWLAWQDCGGTPHMGTFWIGAPLAVGRVQEELWDGAHDAQPHSPEDTASVGVKDTMPFRPRPLSRLVGLPDVRSAHDSGRAQSASVPHPSASLPLKLASLPMALAGPSPPKPS
eukprot:scaffold4916_cov28-Tisochrysis_lutea.AAC.4